MPGEAEGDGEPGVGQRRREGRIRGDERGHEERDGLQRGDAIPEAYNRSKKRAKREGVH
jgi:hypothetical protein